MMLKKDIFIYRYNLKYTYSMSYKVRRLYKMKKAFKILLIIISVCIFVYAVKLYFYKQNTCVKLKIENKNLSYSVKYKNLKKSVDFTLDNGGNYYIAYNSKIQFIGKDGKSYNVIENPNFNITSIDYKDDKLYYSSKDKIYCYNIKNKNNSEFASGIPNYGDYNKSIVKVDGDDLFVSIGAATNSGIVGEDNNWKINEPYAHDITPKDITLKGVNFLNGKTGAFQSYGTKSIKGQVVPAHFPGNASIAVYNLNTKKGSTFAWGIRNVTAMDFNSDNKLICVVGGMENRGSRPIMGDNDYIYEIEKGFWYGWPDYSGGDPIISPKFKGKNDLGFLLENHPNMNPPSPVYQYNKVSSLGSAVVDKLGNIGEKNCIFFYDKIDNLLYSFKYPKVAKKEIVFNKTSVIKSMKLYNKSLLILDSSNGYLYSIDKGKLNSIKNLKEYNNIYIYLIIFIVLIIILILRVRRD